MANDIIGGPEPIIINDRLFQFSPLNDLEFAALESWVQWKHGTRVDILSSEGIEHLGTISGIAQIFSQSVKRTEPLSIIDAALFIDGSEATASHIWDFWQDLNFVSAMNCKDSTKNVGKPYTKAEIYLLLATRFGWTPQQSSLLTPVQQKLMCSKHADGVPTFNTEAEYLQWHSENFE